MKKVFKKSIILIALVLVVSSVFAACGGKNTIIGKWSNSVGGVEVISFEFTKDGKMTVSTAGIVGLTCEYKVDGNKLTYGVAGAETTTEFSVDGNKLTIDYLYTTYTLEKVK